MFQFFSWSFLRHPFKNCQLRLFISEEKQPPAGALVIERVGGASERGVANQLQRIDRDAEAIWRSVANRRLGQF
ncbi:hypothetical protein TNCV_4190331 [Trichonephila clavipes]|nr:hypothetical protein TNCV_4190331 [Trichonephila clavipes]